MRQIWFRKGRRVLLQRKAATIAKISAAKNSVELTGGSMNSWTTPEGSSRQEVKPQGNYRYHFSRQNLLSMSFVVFIIVLMIPLVLNEETDGYFFAGGILGVVSSGVVLVSYMKNPSRRTPSLSLLFFRSLCDMGIGFRFVFNSYFNESLCGDSRCHIDDDEVGASENIFENCAAPSGMIEFFELASEAWFFCLAFDLAVSITNPFSSFKQRLKWYHIFSWSVGLGMALLLSLNKGQHGFWYVDPDVDTTAICWIKSRQSDGSVNYRTFVFLYMPLVIVYVYCCRVLWGAYSHLRKGISKTFQHRVRVLVMNSINIGIYMTYWAVLGILYAFAYAFSSSNEVVSRWFWRIVMFIISSKGFADLLVFILLSDAQVLPGSGEEDSESVDVNSALRQEVLHYSTTGIRECAARKIDLPSKRKLVLLMTQKNIPLQNILTLNHLLRLVFNTDAISAQQQYDTDGTQLPDLSASQLPVDVELFDVDEEVGRPSEIRRSPRKQRSSLAKKMTLPAEFTDSVTGSSPMTSTPDSYIMGWEEDDARGSAGASSTDRSRQTGKPRSSLFGRMAVGRVGGSNGKAAEREIGLRESPSSFSSDGNDDDRNNTLEQATGPAVDDPEIGERASVSDPVGPDHTRDTADYAGENSGLSLCRAWWSWPADFFSSFFSLKSSDVSVEFVEYEPYYFRQIRLSAGVEDLDYITSFMKTIKERLTEGGASGAFFFFTKDEKFIAKSCTLNEIAHIRRSSLMLAKYFHENPESFITKIYGAYKLLIYGTSFYFFVTNNIFLNPANEVINEKYDLKGSWVKRNSTPPQIGQRVTCTHCNQKFVFTSRKNMKKSKKKKRSSIIGRSEEMLEEEQEDRCPMQVLGHHEPNVILKDNDLKYKIRLPAASARFLLHQLGKDSELLFSLGVMDYSLLVGVHNTEYIVDDSTFPSASWDAYKSGSLTGSTATPSEWRVMPRNKSRESIVRKGSATSAPEDVVSPIGGASGDEKGRSCMRPAEQLRSESSDSQDSSLAWAAERATERGERDGPRNGRLMVSRIVGPEAYYMGIVDFQQLYDITKKAERFFKVHVKGNSPEGLSCVEPNAYRARFLRRMEELLDIEV